MPETVIERLYNTHHRTPMEDRVIPIDKSPNNISSLPAITASLSVVGQMRRKHFSTIAEAGFYMWHDREYSLSAKKWDFSAENRTADKRAGFVVQFSLTDSDQVVLVKLFIIDMLETNGRYRQFFAQTASSICRFLSDIRCKDILSADPMKMVECVEKTTEYNRSHIYDFLRFLEVLFDVKIITSDLYDSLMYRAPRAIEAHKTPLIPSAYYHKIADFLYNHVTESYDRYKVAATICVHTGLRISEVCRQKTDCLISVPGYEKQAVMKYLSTKHSGAPIERYFPCDERTTSLIKLCQSKTDNEWLFGEPLNPKKVKEKYEYLLYQHRKALALEEQYDGVPYRARPEWTTSQQPVSIAGLTAYRVYHITLLRHEKVPARIISQIYGHIHDAMEDYYLRDFNQQATDRGHIETLAQALKNNSLMVGPKSALRKQQVEELGKGKAIESISEYMELLSTEFCIKRKQCGYCVQSAGRSCDLDQQTDEYDCAFGRCSNTISFFFNLPESISELHKLIHTANNAHDTGNNITERKEWQKAKRTLAQFILPQITSLEAELKKASPEEIVLFYPEMRDCIDVAILKQKVTEWEELIHEHI